MQSNVSRFTDRVVTLAKKALAGEPNPAVQKGDGGFADWVIISPNGLKEYLGHTFRRLMDVLHEMHGIVGKLDLSVTELPDFSTVCARKQDLQMAVWRVLLRLSTALHETGEIQAIDATGFDCYGASPHYANRTNYTFKAVKTTILVDCQTSVILDIHCSMTNPHDTQIGWQVLKRNLGRVEIITADKGYDSDELRRNLREEGLRPVIKHREFGSLDRAHNARLDDETYHRRSVVESVFFALKHRFDDVVRSRTWFGQFRELVLKAAVRNIELALKDSNS